MTSPDQQWPGTRPGAEPGGRTGSTPVPVLRPLVASDLIIVLTDLQPEIVRRSRTNSETSLRRASGILRDAAGALGIPVLQSVIRLGPGTTSEVISELDGGEPLIRSTVGVFDHDESRNAIRAHGRTVVAVGGVSSEVAVLHAVLGARRLGYPVHVLVDVCGSLDERTEAAAFKRMEAAGATLSSIPSLITELTPDLDSPGFGAMLGLLSRLWSD